MSLFVPYFLRDFGLGNDRPLPGAIKSMMASVMVVSTAASPVLVGLVMDAGSGLEPLLVGGVGSVFVGTLLAFRVFPAYARIATAAG